MILAAFGISKSRFYKPFGNFDKGLNKKILNLDVF